MNCKTLTIVTAFILLAMMPLSGAYGITAFYWEPDRMLLMQPGETKDINLLVQNMVGGEDAEIKVKLTEGTEIATITDESDTYSIPFGRKDIPINIRVTLPQNAATGTKYLIKVAAADKGGSEGGMVDFATPVIPTIPVQVTEATPQEAEAASPATGNVAPSPEPKGVNYGWVALMALALIIVVIAYFALKGKKGKQQFSVKAKRK